EDTRAHGEDRAATGLRRGPSSAGCPTRQDRVRRAARPLVPPRSPRVDARRVARGPGLVSRRRGATTARRARVRARRPRSPPLVPAHARALATRARRGRCARRRLRVLHIHRIGGIGGSERHLLTLLPALAARGVDVHFLGLDDPTRAPNPFYERLQVPYERISAPRDLDPLLALRVNRAIRHARPHVTHTHLV